MTRKKQALDAKRANIFLVDPDQLYLETKPSKKHYDSRVHEPFQERVVQGMLKHGVKQTISATKLGNLTVVVDGRQRVINAREAKRRQLADGLPEKQTIRVPVRVERGSETKLFEVAVLTNEHRKPENPVSQAEKIQAYLDMGNTEEDAADFWGVSGKTITNRIKLLDLAPELRKAIAEGKLKVSKALKWVGLSYEDQVARFTAKPDPKKKKRRPTKKRVTSVLENSEVPEPFKKAIRWLRGEISDKQAGVE